MNLRAKWLTPAALGLSLALATLTTSALPALGDSVNHVKLRNDSDNDMNFTVYRNRFVCIDSDLSAFVLAPGRSIELPVRTNCSNMQEDYISLTTTDDTGTPQTGFFGISNNNNNLELHAELASKKLAWTWRGSSPSYLNIGFSVLNDTSTQ